MHEWWNLPISRTNGQRWWTSAARRTCSARRPRPGRIYLRPETLAAIRDGKVVKGNVLATARVAATLAIKNTPGLIPMCHSIPISAITVDFTEHAEFIDTTVVVKTTGKTGVEMEALTGCLGCPADGMGHGQVGGEG